MFTGIIQEVGTVVSCDRSGGVWRLVITCPAASKGVMIGDSIAINGICLTVVGSKNDAVWFDVMKETAVRSNLGSLSTGTRVNVESALKLGDHLGGHIVQGHIDCVGTVRRVVKDKAEFAMEVTTDREHAHLVVEKGSVALDGISLTVGRVSDDGFTVFLIPHTLAITTLGMRNAGDALNVEFDIVGKYIARSKELEKKGSGVSEELLRRAKFI